MTNTIASEDQAQSLGEQITNGKRGKDFTVFFYEDKRSRLTLFGIKIITTGKQITVV